MTKNHGKAEQQAARGRRLAAALRENLKRRKEQARGRVGNRADGKAAQDDAGTESQAPDFRRNRGSD